MMKNAAGIEKVEALDAGANDYVVKPFGIQERLAGGRARVSALHRNRAGRRLPLPRLTGSSRFCSGPPGTNRVKIGSFSPVSPLHFPAALDLTFILPIMGREGWRRRLAGSSGRHVKHIRMSLQTHNTSSRIIRSFTMKQLLKQFWQEESGATLVEYAIIVALIAVATITVIGTLQGSINDVFSEISGELNDAIDD